MSTIYEGLMAKDISELQVLAMQHGLPKPHHRAKKETIVKMIVEAATTKPAAQEQNKAAPVVPADEKKDGPQYMSRESVEAMLEPIRRNKPDFQAIYSNDDTVVTFRYKGSEECHNLTTSPRWLKQRAEIVSRGRLALMGYETSQFEQGTATGKNSYTNVVLR